MSATLYIVRHGQTDYNKLGIIQGSGVDSSLNKQGQKQAAHFFEYYKKEKFEKIYTSSLIRTNQTMQRFETIGYELVKHPELNEINWGIHEGKHPTTKMKREYNQLIEAWKLGETDLKVPEGESPKEVAKRLIQFLTTLKSGLKPSNYLICSHGRTIRILLCCLLKLDLKSMDQFEHRNVNLYQLKWDGETAELLLRNNVDHLKISQ